MANEASRKLMALALFSYPFRIIAQISRRSLHFHLFPRSFEHFTREHGLNWTARAKERERDASKEKFQAIEKTHLHAASISPPCEIDDESNSRMPERLIIFHCRVNRSKSFNRARVTLATEIGSRFTRIDRIDRTDESLLPLPLSKVVERL